MKTVSFATIAFAAALSVTQASADVFSSQGFDGGTASADQLPGVNLDAVPGISSTNGSNCVESPVTGFSAREGRSNGATMTECRFGNFSITTTGNSSNFGYDKTYNGNPAPWAETWRP